MPNKNGDRWPTNHSSCPAMAQLDVRKDLLQHKSSSKLVITSIRSAAHPGKTRCRPIGVGRSLTALQQAYADGNHVNRRIALECSAGGANG